MYRISFRKSVLSEYKPLETMFDFLIWILPGTKMMLHISNILKLAKPINNSKTEFKLIMRKASTL